MKQYKPRRRGVILPPSQEAVEELAGVRVQIRLSKNQIWRYVGKTVDGRTHLVRGQVDILLTDAPLRWLFKEVGAKTGKTLLEDKNG